MPLCSEVLLESRYASILKRHRLPELQVGDIGLGSVDTWHGTPDARLRGMEVVWRKDSGDTCAVVEEVVSEDEGSVQSVGASTAVEGKVLTTQLARVSWLPSWQKHTTLSKKHLYQLCLSTRNSFVSACMIVKKIYYHKQTASHKRSIVKEWHGFTLVGHR